MADLSDSTTPIHTTEPMSSSTPAANGSASTTSTTAADNLENIKSSVASSAQSAMAAIQNNQTVQSISNGPVAENVKTEAAKTSNEFQSLANARTTPSKPAATGQTLTHYHSFFYNLLSWENPRATSIAFAGTVLFILATRYLNIGSWIFKIVWSALAITAGLEVVGKTIFDTGLATRMRPRKYYTIPRESLEASLEDVEQLVNFFVIEFQRILFAESVFATGAAFIASFISYFLIRIVPFWGMTLIATCNLFLLPLIYVKNRETIDGLLNQAQDVASNQATQLKSITAEHTGKASSTLKSYTNEYTSKAQQYMGRRSPSPSAQNPSIKVEEHDLPSAPKTEPTVSSESVTPSAPAVQEAAI